MVGTCGPGEASVSENGELGQASRWPEDVRWGMEARTAGFGTEVQTGTKKRMKTALRSPRGLGAAEGPRGESACSPPPRGPRAARGAL